MPVSAVRAPARTSKADREAAKRVSKLSDDEFDKATAETASERAEAPTRNADTEPFPREVAGRRRPKPAGAAGPRPAPRLRHASAGAGGPKSGLHIEPWRQAIDAYERAAGAAAPRVRPPMP